MSLTPNREATVVVALIADNSGGIADTLEAVEAQVYAPSRVVVVGDTSVGSVETADSLNAVIESLDISTAYVWVVREGSIPASDALSALISDAERIGAGVIGSKIVGPDGLSLVSIGLVTDVFDVAYTGLEGDERDQGQYDVVREVAAVSGSRVCRCSSVEISSWASVVSTAQ